MKGVEQLIEGDPTSLVVSNNLEIPPTEATDIVIKVACVGVNRLDLIQASGNYKVPEGVSEVLGLEVSGLVITVGNSCTKGFKEGDTVFALLSGGGYAEIAAVNENLCFPAIPTLSLTQMCSIPETFLTAFQLAFFIAKAESGQSALVHAGASGVGQILTRMLTGKGVNVIATTRSRSKIDVCIKSGASDVILPVTTTNSGRDLIALGKSGGDDAALDTENAPPRKKYFAAKAIDANGGIVGEHFDMVFCPVGGDYLDENLACLKQDGKLVLYGLMGGTDMPIDGSLMSKILFKRISLLPSTLRSRSLEYKSELAKAFYEDETVGYPALSSGRIQPLDVEYTCPLEDVMKAHTVMQKNRNVGKIVLMVSDQTNTLEYFAREMQQLEERFISPSKDKDNKDNDKSGDKDEYKGGTT